MTQETHPSMPQRQAAARRATCLELREVARRVFYRLWRAMPLRCQRLAVRIAAPKVTMGACAVILDGRGRVLLAHHTYRANPWGLPGGLVSAREHPSAGLARELREELGVAAQVGPVLSAETNAATHQLTLYYRATLLGTPHEDGVEIDGFCYASPEEVATLLGNDASICLHCMQA
jgi:8-oxo-dGTP pyrophosphatase MutT (NUDIX family)